MEALPDELHLPWGERRGRFSGFGHKISQDVKMFPTGVGMNRRTYLSIVNVNNVPHRRGDEPWAQTDGLATG